MSVNVLTTAVISELAIGFNYITYIHTSVSFTGYHSHVSMAATYYYSWTISACVHALQKIFYQQPLMYIFQPVNPLEYTVEPLNKDTFGTSRFALCREVVLFELPGVIFYRVGIQEYFQRWEVCPLLECPLSEVSL